MLSVNQIKNKQNAQNWIYYIVCAEELQLRQQSPRIYSYIQALDWLIFNARLVCPRPRRVYSVAAMTAIQIDGEEMHNGAAASAASAATVAVHHERRTRKRQRQIFILLYFSAGVGSYLLRYMTNFIKSCLAV